MPYITNDKRHELKPELEALVLKYRELQKEEYNPGNLAYVLYVLAMSHLEAPREDHIGYKDYMEVLGILESVTNEYKIMNLDRYERQKLVKNGRVEGLLK